MDIQIKSIAQCLQRYPTLGDYWEKGNKTHVRVSRQKKWQYEALIAIHELVELFLVKQRKVSIKKIDGFDKEMEEIRGAIGYYAHLRFSNKPTKLYRNIVAQFFPCYGIDCLKTNKKSKENYDEPGICARAPYHKEHMAAMKIEKLLCEEFGIKWADYNKYVCSL